MLTAISISFWRHVNSPLLLIFELDFTVVVPQTQQFLLSYLQACESFLLPAQLSLWILLIIFKILIMIIFSSRISFCFLFLGFLFLYWYFYFVITLFSWLSLPLPLVLSASLTVILNFLSSIYVIRSFLGEVSVDFCLLISLNSLWFLLMLYKTGHLNMLALVIRLFSLPSFFFFFFVIGCF